MPASNSSYATSWLARARSYRPFLIFAATYLLLVQLTVCVLSIPIAARGAADFRQLYTAGYMLRTGHAHQLYDYNASGEFQNTLVGPASETLPFNHLAYEAALFVPLSWLSYRAAYFTFLSVNLALLAACFALLRPRIKPLEQVWIGLPVVLFACFYPITVALIQGQDSILLLALMAAAFVALEADRPIVAGICVGLTAFKFQFTLPVLFLLMAWRSRRWWRASLSGALTAATLSCVSLAISGIREFSAYLRSLLSMGTGVQSVAQRQVWAIYPEAMPNLRGLVSAMAGRLDAYHSAPLLSGRLVGGLIIAASVGMLVWAARSRPSFPLAVTAAVLVSYHGLIHDAALLVIPVVALGREYLDPWRPFEPWPVIVAGSIVAIPTILWMAGSWFCLMAIVLVLLAFMLSGRRAVALV